MSLCRCVLATLLALAWTNLGQVPLAFARDDVESAKAHYSKATRLYEVGNYRQALEEFKEAHLAKPDPAFLYNIGQCHRQLGDLEQAATLYRRFLTAAPNTPNRAEVEKRVAEMESELAERRRKGAAEQPALPAPAQSEAIAPALGAPAPTPPVANPPAVTSPVSPQAQDAPPPAAAPPAAQAATAMPGTVVQPGALTTVPESKPAVSSLRLVRWVGVGLTLALVGGAIISGISASSKYDNLKNSCGNTDAGCADGDIDRVKSRVLLTNLLWGAAGVAAAGTGVAFYLTPHQSAVQVAWRF